MPDIHADYTGLADTCGQLSTQCNIIIPEIYSLMGRVETLLDNGLYLEQASPALKTAYEEFSRSLHMAAENLQHYANLFTQIRDSFENNDTALFASTLSNLDGEGGYETTADEVTSPTPPPPTFEGPMDGTSVTWNEDRTQVTGTG